MEYNGGRDFKTEELYKEVDLGEGRKKSKAWKYIAGAAGGLAGLALLWNVFGPGLGNKAEYKGVEEKPKVAKKVEHSGNVALVSPEEVKDLPLSYSGLNEKESVIEGPKEPEYELTVEDVEKIRTLPEKERKAALKEILKRKKPPKPGLKPYLDGLAWIDDEGWIYPDEVEKDKYGRYLYDFTNPEHVVLAKKEAYNNRDPSLFAKVSWRTWGDWKEKVIKSIQEDFKKPPEIVTHRYKILKIEQDRNFNNENYIVVTIYWKGDTWHRRLVRINGEWEFW
ncbi:hypothetical protein DRJ04_06920 [Candidatus Aerophobetes bacterium]|uniref:Uncharacterized protein n=1 Tax=Aerophobetes bacterium TaxID=2030807 RepID=A0A662DC08_UNCAE|nr:MAG: hypothetical protein DRJ04_06920 [Candidatus Aerophobetes bacterium]